MPEVIGHEDIYKYLQRSLDKDRIAHAQLFIGYEGCGMLQVALWYAKEILHTAKDPLTHPDLHFMFPVANSAGTRSKTTSAYFMDKWREFIRTKPYGSLFDWYKFTEVENKQGQIGTDDVREAIKKLVLKPYESAYKVMLIWMADKMNASAVNKMLKIIEEPPEKTVIILMTEHEDQITDTLRSRCQGLYFRRLSESATQKILEDKGVQPQRASQIAHCCQGDINKAFDMMNNDSEDATFEKWFVDLVRIAFSAKGNKAGIIPLMNWCEDIAKQGREVQKHFLHFCISVFRQAMLKNYGVEEMVFIDALEGGFLLERFAPFVHDRNILDIADNLERAIYHIERNGSSKIVFSDLAIHLTRLIHIKP